MNINIQPIEKRNYREDGMLEVHSIFNTIQGEGPLTGHPAIFVRLAGCNLQCPKCDTEYTFGRMLMSAESLVQAIRNLHDVYIEGPRLVVITGGEPFRQNITYFCHLLLDVGYEVQVETNGTLGFPGGEFPARRMYTDSGVTIVCSPKTGKVHEDIIFGASAFKYVLSHDSVDPDDGLPLLALGHTASPKLARPHEAISHWPKGAIYLQPADHQDPIENAKNLRAVIDSCMKHGYTLQLQVHKLIDME